jgi:hypothetical protein
MIPQSHRIILMGLEEHKMKPPAFENSTLTQEHRIEAL